MKELFMKLLWYFADMGVTVEGMSLSKRGSRYADMDIMYEGKKYNITIREEEDE